MLWFGCFSSVSRGSLSLGFSNGANMNDKQQIDNGTEQATEACVVIMGVIIGLALLAAFVWAVLSYAGTLLKALWIF